jgi:hypothetical protein
MTGFRNNQTKQNNARPFEKRGLKNHPVPKTPPGPKTHSESKAIAKAADKCTQQTGENLTLFTVFVQS